MAQFSVKIMRLNGSVLGEKQQPQVRLRKRLDLARDAEVAAGGVPGLIVAKWVEGKV